MALVPRCREALGSPVCLINNASEFLVDTLPTATMETWDTHLDINLKAPVFLAQSLFLNLAEGETGQRHQHHRSARLESHAGFLLLYDL